MNKKYQIIYADPPWYMRNDNYGHIGSTKLSGFGASSRYPTMSCEDICKLPIKKITDTNCALLL